VMIDRVYEALSPKSVRTLNELINVYGATKINVSIKAKVFLFDMQKANDIQNEILDNFTNSFYIGQDLPKSAIVRKMHVGGVYKVEVENLRDYIISNREIIEIVDIELDFEEVSGEPFTI